MLKVECTNCREWVGLHLEAGVPEVVCPGCAAPIEVKDIHVAAGPFTIYRDVLATNLSKYKRLLSEAHSEMEELKKSGEKQKGYEVTIRSMGTFVSNLRELLDGCRNDPRHPVKDNFSVEYSVDGRAYAGTIVNISVSGACVEPGRNTERLRLWSAIELALGWDGRQARLPGKIVWIGRTSLMGVRFDPLDEGSRGFLKDYIMGNSAIMERR